MCHAQVHSNMITNFGYGEPYYFSQNTPTGVGRGYYGDWVPDNPAEGNWATATVYGKIFVPKAPMPANVFPHLATRTLASYLQSVVQVIPTTQKKPVIEEYSKIYIGAPTRDQILNAANFHPLPLSSAIKYIKRTPQSPDLSGLTEAIPLVQNDPKVPVVCDGDLIINNRTLYLNQLKIDTINGCNIYVAGRSVLIHGYITFYNSSPKRNLQISSSRAILMGLGVGSYMHGTAKEACHILSDRLTQEAWSVH